MKTLNELAKDFAEIEVRKQIIEQYGNSDMPFEGVNADGEMTELHVAPDGIIKKTYQANGWLRVNYYDANGHDDGETFEGKWK